MHTSRYRGSASSHSPTTNQGSAKSYHCARPQQNPYAYARGECISSPRRAIGARSRWDTSSLGQDTQADMHQLEAVCKCLMGRHPSNYTPLKGYTQEPRLPTGHRPDTLAQTRQPGHWNWGTN